MVVKQQFRFEAAHRLPNHRGKCVRPHGHSYRFEVSLDRPVDPRTGMTMDFFDIEEQVRARVVSELDHRDLNEIIENPTAENIAIWIWGRLEGSLPGLSALELWEVEGSSVLYRGEAAVR